MGTDFEASNFDAWCDVEHLLEDIAHDLAKYDDNYCLRKYLGLSSRAKQSGSDGRTPMIAKPLLAILLLLPLTAPDVAAQVKRTQRMSRR